MSQWNREIAPALYQHTTRQMGRRPAVVPHKADKLDGAVNVLCYCPGIREALSRVPAIRGYARTCRWDSLTGELNTAGKKKNPYLQHTEQRKREAPHESKEPKVKNKCAMHLRQLSTLQSQLLRVGNLFWRGQRPQYGK